MKKAWCVILLIAELLIGLMAIGLAWIVGTFALVITVAVFAVVYVGQIVMLLKNRKSENRLKTILIALIPALADIALLVCVFMELAKAF